MKDSYSFDVDDAGLEVSYQRHRDAYIKTFDRLGLPYVIVVGDVGGDGRLGERGVPRPARRRRGHVRAHQVGLVRGERRGRARSRRPTRSRTTTPRRRVDHDTPGTPTIATLVDLLNARDDLRLADREWTAADTLKNVIVMLEHPDGTREPLAIGVPGDRDVDMKRLEAAVSPAEAVPFTRRGLRPLPGAGQGLHRARRARRRQRDAASASCATPASSPAPAG